MSELLSFIEAVKKSPENTQCWLELAEKAADLNEKKTALSAYLAALCLQPEQAVFEKTTDSRQKYIDSLNVENKFHLDILRLPKRTTVILLVGMLNMEIESVEKKVKSLMDKGNQKILLDFFGLQFLSGLGPSTLKKLIKYAQEKECLLAFTNVSNEIQGMLDLKGVKTPQFSNVLEMFQQEGSS